MCHLEFPEYFGLVGIISVSEIKVSSRRGGERGGAGWNPRASPELHPEALRLLKMSGQDMWEGQPVGSDLYVALDLELYDRSWAFPAQPALLWAWE